MSNLLDERPQLPAQTAEGLNTFGCFVNGNLFLPSPVPGQRRSVYGELQYYHKITGINIYVDDYRTNRALVIFLYNPNALTPGELYDLSGPEFFVQYIDFNKAPTASYLAEVRGTIRIGKCELSAGAQRVIAGSFEFTVSNQGSEETASVTDGRFDIGDIIE